MWLGQTLQPSRGNAFGKAQKPRLHVGRKGSDFGGDGFIEDFNSPSHYSYISILRSREESATGQSIRRDDPIVYDHRHPRERARACTDLTARQVAEISPSPPVGRRGLG